MIEDMAKKTMFGIIVRKIWATIQRFFKRLSWKQWLLWVVSIGIILTGIFIIWASTLKLPDFKLFTEQKLQSSTKIYDRTGKILLYNANQDIKRTVIPSEDMGVNIKNATVAIEDSNFYNDKGIRLSSIFRGTVWAVLTGRKIQGGSTITQQLIKITLLTSERSVIRKVKEWILAIKLEQVMSKEDILALYLNQIPYGGNIYGIDEAAEGYFGVAPADLTLAQAAYLAAIPNAPSYYSPYGDHMSALVDRKNLVLQRMLDLKFITQDQYNQAVAEKVTFLPQQPTHIAAPHFVFFILNYLYNKYGEDVVDNGGLKVVTTLDYNLEEKAEALTLAGAKENEKKANGSNAAVVVIDPKTGQILSMVGSRDYFDKTIDGNFNVTTAARQPGSSFKPIVYAQAFQDGYTENTTLFDTKTEFNASCGPDDKPLPGHEGTTCYMPSDFDNAYRGPMTLKNALAQSINIVAIKLLYLVGIPNALNMAHSLGITTLNDPSRYGLSLVIGGGETTLLDMTSAYSVFANEGVRNPYTGILSVQDSSGKVLEQYQDKSYSVLDPNIANTISDILSDNTARTPTFGPNSTLVVPGHQVAVKTGTTNNDKDAWTIGYTPSVAVGVWVGNNDDTPMKGGGSALAGPIWNGVITEALKNLPVETFNKPNPIDPTLPPIIRGFWQGGHTFTIDKASGGLATQFTPDNMKKEQSITDVHTILYWINKDNPLGPIPTDPTTDPQYTNWEYGVQNWWQANKSKYPVITESDIPTSTDTIHTATSKPTIDVSGLDATTTYAKDASINISMNIASQNPIRKVDVFVNNTYVTSLKSAPFIVSFKPKDIAGISDTNTLHIIAYDTVGNSGEATATFSVQNN
jgi:penicillin-binding protein 1C